MWINVHILVDFTSTSAFSPSLKKQKTERPSPQGLHFHSTVWMPWPLSFIYITCLVPQLFGFATPVLYIAIPSESYINKLYLYIFEKL